MDFFLDLPSLLENALFGVTGAALASFFVWAVRRFKDWLHEREFSISGEYRAHYEDTSDGKSVIHTETVYLKQRGLRIIAEHEARDTNQGWVSEGQIDPTTHYITGYYRAKAVTDAGVGVFVLAPKSERELDGIWAGYNSKTKSTTQGRYTFTRALPVQVRRAQKLDLVKVMQLASKELGEDYLTLESLNKHFHNDLIYVAVYEGQIVGFAIGRMIATGSLKSDVLKGQSYKVPNDLLLADEHGHLGLLQSVATDTAYKGQGVGNKMVKKLIKTLEKKGARQIVSVGWTTDTVHIGSVLQSYNFIPRAEFKKFWAEESLRKNYECPDCGAPPCECTATLFSRA